MDVKVITKSKEPVNDAIVSLKAVPYKGVFPDIASITNDEGIAGIPCECHKGKYSFIVVTEEHGRFDVDVEVTDTKSRNPIYLILDIK
ncbi:hypothetical protein [Porphyromonas sp.]|uniref:hypothetical protein n=1 Tax=Porphyromonas sp. TaxID=1924944 RepID=UPI0026DD900D|nr:hypothetical protein [Porphyromonas sp.]MDO4695847.1 hypothetical protein [Porphyromonas sp.]MDO4771438.1 hypothetical protein [Porphyromonas sp.]